MLETLAEIDAAFPWFFRGLFLVLGAVVGSFLNVCIHRIPLNRSIVTPGSTCACGRPVAWHDNIPVLSWVILRGRARCCGRPFSVRYPAVELLTALLFLACWLRLEPTRALVGMVFVSVLICAAFIDLDHMIIPDRFTIGAAMLGLLVSVMFPSIHGHATGIAFVDGLRGFLTSLTGVLIGSGVVLWIALVAEVILRKEAMGFGDVKFLGAIGAFLGWQGGVFAVFGGAVLGTFAFAVALSWQGLRRRSASSEDGRLGLGRQTPFGPMLAAGAALYLLWAGPYVDAYFALIGELLLD